MTLSHSSVSLSRLQDIRITEVSPSAMCVTVDVRRGNSCRRRRHKNRRGRHRNRRPCHEFMSPVSLDCCSGFCRVSHASRVTEASSSALFAAVNVPHVISSRRRRNRSRNSPRHRSWAFFSIQTASRKMANPATSGE